jgi:hypothetical protein
MAKLLTSLQHPDQLINRIQDGIVQTVNPLLKAWYDKFSIPGDCSGTLIAQRVTLADDWIAPTLLNSWVNFGAGFDPAGYRKCGGDTQIRGLLKLGTLTASSFLLPAAYRPPASVIVATTTNGAHGFLEVAADGNVLLQSSSNVWASVHVRFAASDPSPVPNPVFPLTLAHGLTPGKTPTTVLLADAVDTVSLAHVSSSCSWRIYDDTHVQIIDLPGLYALRTYDLTFLVLGG